MDIYCHQLGMLIELSYCTAQNEGLPCRNIIGCWEKRTDIFSFLKGKFTDEQLKNIFSGLPKTRLERIIESLRKE